MSSLRVEKATPWQMISIKRRLTWQYLYTVLYPKYCLFKLLIFFPFLLWKHLTECQRWCLIHNNTLSVFVRITMQGVVGFLVSLASLLVGIHISCFLHLPCAGVDNEHSALQTQDNWHKSGSLESYFSGLMCLDLHRYCLNVCVSSKFFC